MKFPVKDREAQQFRASAAELRAKLVDPNIQMTADEVKSATDGIAAFEARANAAGGFTPEKEIEDQGGDEKLKALASPENDLVERDGNMVIKRNKLKGAIESLREDIAKHFEGSAQYLQYAASARSNGFAGLSTAQKSVMERAQMITRTVVGTTGDASGAEFLLPLQQETSIFSLSNVQSGIMQHARRYTVNGRTLRIPYLSQADGLNTRPAAGIANITIVGEAGAKPVREPQFLQRLLTVYKYAAIAQIGDETLADDMTGDLQPAIVSSVGQQVLNRMNEDFTIDGSGTAMPLGALHASNASRLSVNRTTSNLIKTTDIFPMYSRHTLGPQSRWLCSRRVIEQLMGMTLGNNTLVTYLPGLNGVPEMRLLGLPVEQTDLLPTLGSTGDIALVNPEFYAMAIRTQLTVESSIHVAFVNDVTTFRFFARGGGVPIPDGTYAYKSNGSSSGKIDEHSPFVVLAA